MAIFMGQGCVFPCFFCFVFIFFIFVRFFHAFSMVFPWFFPRCSAIFAQDQAKVPHDQAESSTKAEPLSGERERSTIPSATWTCPDPEEGLYPQNGVCLPHHFGRFTMFYLLLPCFTLFYLVLPVFGGSRWMMTNHQRDLKWGFERIGMRILNTNQLSHRGMLGLFSSSKADGSNFLSLGCLIST